ncbi:hypothetical protein O0I10_002804 [Lichtheimia ornata]|uniref:MIT domain-containing protein n=1 Tax=Lichtheimia ornata TaxID=688661 RepID=A0AAD7Y2N4_9FUNG|nr:uncharacterized protein O0I10_002804 [Lichtheimia ornata]KAJ8661537.1 hypothetical protein O0I10_002804 [Lichtheimia ornata]
MIFSRSSNSKRKSHTPSSTSTPLLSRLNVSTPAVYYTNQNNSSASNVSPRATDMNPSLSYGGGGSPIPTPSTSWTSEMSVLADKIRDDTVHTVDSLDRRSISQGMKLVAIAADEYEDGNNTVALDIYLSGIDKILMALPNKTDPKTKVALREKLTSVEERVGILHIASQHRQKRYQEEWDDPEVKRSLLESIGLSRITTTISTITTIASNRAYPPASNTPSSVMQHQASAVAVSSSPSSSPPSRYDPVDRFKQFGQTIINATVTLAILIKQSPLPDVVYFLFGYLCQMLIWVDHQYHITQKAQDLGVECVKWMLKMDEQYRLHEFASEAMYMLIAAGLKAAVAYKEAPAFRQNTSHIHEITDDDQDEHYSHEAIEPCPPPKRPSRWVIW